jgi:DNA invertase Pin-like site-specific DNA recombinase
MQLAQAPAKNAQKTTRIQWDLQKVVIYRRVSTDEQGNSGLGLEAQDSQCLNVVRSLGLSVAGNISEVVSGKIDPRERDGFLEALAICQSEGARLMVAKLDRLSREVYHVSGYCDKYFYGPMTPDLITADSPTASMLEIRLKSVIAQEEREMISARTKAALQARKERGAAPNGETGRSNATAKKREATKDAIARAEDLRAAGLGYKRIADTLNAEGLTTSTGGKWYPMGIRSRLSTIGRC